MSSRSVRVVINNVRPCPILVDALGLHPLVSLDTDPGDPGKSTYKKNTTKTQYDIGNGQYFNKTLMFGSFTSKNSLPCEFH